MLKLFNLHAVYTTVHIFECSSSPISFNNREMEAFHRRGSNFTRWKFARIFIWLNNSQESDLDYLTNWKFGFPYFTFHDINFWNS